MASAFVSSPAEVVLIDSRTRQGTITLPLTNAIPFRVLNFKDQYGTFFNSTLTLSTQVGESFDDGTTSKVFSNAFGAASLYATSSKWMVLNATTTVQQTISSLTVNQLTFGTGAGWVQFGPVQATVLSSIQVQAQSGFFGDMNLGTTSTVTTLDYYGLFGNYNNTVLAEISTGAGTQEFLVFKGSSTSDRVRVQTTGTFVVETGVSSRLWNSNTIQTLSNVTPAFIINTSSNVGIQTASPGATLDVAGTGRFQIVSTQVLNVSSINGSAYTPGGGGGITSLPSTLSTFSLLTSSINTSTLITPQFVTTANALTLQYPRNDPSTFFLFAASTGFIGIGTSSPSNVLEVKDWTNSNATGSILSVQAGQPGLAPSTSNYYYFTGSQQTYTVPTNVYRLEVHLWGGGGGGGFNGGSGGAGGGGAYVAGFVDVTPGEQYYYRVAGAGNRNGAGGFGGGGGGNSNSGGGGGAGASWFIRVTGAVTLGVAGGGGGGGAFATTSAGGAATYSGVGFRAGATPQTQTTTPTVAMGGGGDTNDVSPAANGATSGGGNGTAGQGGLWGGGGASGGGGGGWVGGGGGGFDSGTSVHGAGGGGSSYSGGFVTVTGENASGAISGGSNALRINSANPSAGTGGAANVSGSDGLITIIEYASGTAKSAKLVNLLSPTGVTTSYFGSDGALGLNTSNITSGASLDVLGSGLIRNLGVSSLSTGVVLNPLRVGTVSSQSVVLFPGLTNQYSGTAVAEVSTGSGTQELLLYKVSSATDRVRVQTTGTFIVETGVSARAWPTTASNATPAFLITASSNVGIQTASPGATLDVAGTGRFQLLSTLALNVSTINGSAYTPGGGGGTTFLVPSSFSTVQLLTSSLTASTATITSGTVSSIVTNTMTIGSGSGWILTSPIQTLALSTNTLYAEQTYVTTENATTALLSTVTTNQLTVGTGGGWILTSPLQTSIVSSIYSFADSGYFNTVNVGSVSTVNSIQFAGLFNAYSNTALAEISTGAGTQELLVFKGSSASDRVRVQTTGTFVVETGVSARLWNSNTTQTLSNATPAFIINASSNVGIQTASPGATLDVAGTARAITLSSQQLFVSSMAAGVLTAGTVSSLQVNASTATVPIVTASSVTTNAVTIGSVPSWIQISPIQTAALSTNTLWADQTYVTTENVTTGNISAITTNSLTVGVGGSWLQTAPIQTSVLSTIYLYASQPFLDTVNIGSVSTLNSLEFAGLFNAYNNTALAEISTGAGTQELLVFKGSSASDRVRVQTTGTFVVETGVSARLFNSNTTQTLSNATPAFIINASSNVGIQTASPGATLDVAGTGRFLTLSTQAIFASSIVAPYTFVSQLIIF